MITRLWPRCWQIVGLLPLLKVLTPTHKEETMELHCSTCGCIGYGFRKDDLKTEAANHAKPRRGQPCQGMVTMRPETQPYTLPFTLARKAKN